MLSPKLNLWRMDIGSRDYPNFHPMIAKTTSRILALGVASLVGVSAYAAPVTANFNDLILGFRASGGTGASDNLVVDLGSITKFTGASGTINVTQLAAADLSAIYGSSWSNRIGNDLYWGVVGTTGRTAAGPGGQPSRTLWASSVETTGGTSTAWTRGTSTSQGSASAIIEGVYTGGPASLSGANATANSASAADVIAASSGSWSSQELNSGGVAFGFFNPISSFDSAGAGFNAFKADLYELRPIAGTDSNPGTLLGTFTLSTTGVLTFTAAATTPTAPAITTQPTAQTATAGNSVTFSVVASGSPAPSYQWNKNGTAITGATNASYTISSAQSSDAGNYSVTVSNGVGSAVTSSAVALTVNASTTPVTTSRIINLSILTGINAPGDTFTLGYVVAGASASNSLPVVIRAAGPALGALGVGGTLADPKIDTFAGANSTGTNDNWGGSQALATAMASVGAFAYASPTSKDAAIATNITSQDNSVRVSATDNGTGQVIAEVYDATPSASVTANSPRLVNVSVLKNIGTGSTMGFVINGTGSKKLLIRAVGPGLAVAPFNIAGVVADPQIVLTNVTNSQSPVQVGSNDNWDASLAATFTAVSAFSLPAGSKDAAMVVTLQPGNYTVQVSGVGGTTGIAIIEVYEVQQ